MPTRKIRDVITDQTILTTPADLSVREAARRMVATGVGSIMITVDGKLTGIFTERDALIRVLAAGLDPETTTLAQVMTAAPITASPEIPLGHALHMMYEGGFRHVPVVEDGRPVGMISARDALGLEIVAFESELQRRESISELL